VRKKSTPKIDAELKLEIGSHQASFHISVDEGPTSPATLLEFVQEFTDKVVQIGVENSINDGNSISCKKGCGACCAQLVPVTEIEIRHIASLIRNLPRPTKLAVMERFEHAREKLRAAGFWQRLFDPLAIDLEDSNELSLSYFELGINCPFLVDESCSIHADRPIACREYLVTSDAGFCKNPRAGNIDGVSIPIRLSTIFGRLCEEDTNHHADWVPLIVAPYWQAAFPALPSKKTGQQWVELFLDKLTKSTKSSTAES
jgi:Fe-S-cluster containining protein